MPVIPKSNLNGIDAARSMQGVNAAEIGRQAAQVATARMRPFVELGGIAARGLAKISDYQRKLEEVEENARLRRMMVEQENVMADTLQRFRENPDDYESFESDAKAAMEILSANQADEYGRLSAAGRERFDVFRMEAGGKFDRARRDLARQASIAHMLNESEARYGDYVDRRDFDAAAAELDWQAGSGLAGRDQTEKRRKALESLRTYCSVSDEIQANPAAALKALSERDERGAWKNYSVGEKERTELVRQAQKALADRESALVDEISYRAGVGESFDREELKRLWEEGSISDKSYHALDIRLKKDEDARRAEAERLAREQQELKAKQAHWRARYSPKAAAAVAENRAEQAARREKAEQERLDAAAHERQQRMVAEQEKRDHEAVLDGFGRAMQAMEWSKDPAERGVQVASFKTKMAEFGIHNSPDDYKALLKMLEATAFPDETKNNAPQLAYFRDRYGKMDGGGGRSFDKIDEERFYSLDPEEKGFGGLFHWDRGGADDVVARNRRHFELVMTRYIATTPGITSEDVDAMAEKVLREIGETSVDELAAKWSLSERYMHPRFDWNEIPEGGSVSFGGRTFRKNNGRISEEY